MDGSDDSFPVSFDQQAFTEDLKHATLAGRVVGQQARSQLERNGLPASELRRCEPEGRDGSRLAACVKTYLPQPAGDWGMVFIGSRSAAGRFELRCIAFGRRHPISPWQPSVYELAHRRLNRPRA